MPIIPETPHDYKEQLAWEKELLGMYVSDHPIAKALEGLDLSDVTPLSRLGDESVGKTLTFVGMLQGARRLTTKKGDSMLVANLEDLEATAELVAFPKSYERCRELLVDDALLRITAKVDKRNESLQLLLESAETLDAARAAPLVAELPPQMDLEGQGDYIPSGVSDNVAMIAPLDDVPHPAERGESAVALGAPVSEPPPDDATPISIIRSRIKAGSNGNGHMKGNSNGISAAAPPQVAAHSLRLYLPRTSDFDADVLLMQKIDRMLRQSAGDDNVIIHMPNTDGVVLLQPRHKVRCTDELLDTLRSELGPESVVLED